MIHSPPNPSSKLADTDDQVTQIVHHNPPSSSTCHLNGDSEKDTNASVHEASMIILSASELNSEPSINVVNDKSVVALDDHHVLTNGECAVIRAFQNTNDHQFQNVMPFANAIPNSELKLNNNPKYQRGKFRCLGQNGEFSPPAKIEFELPNSSATSCQKFTNSLPILDGINGDSDRKETNDVMHIISDITETIVPSPNQKSRGRGRPKKNTNNLANCVKVNGYAEIKEERRSRSPSSNRRRSTRLKKLEEKKESITKPSFNQIDDPTPNDLNDVSSDSSQACNGDISFKADLEASSQDSIITSELDKNTSKSKGKSKHSKNLKGKHKKSAKSNLSTNKENDSTTNVSKTVSGSKPDENFTSSTQKIHLENGNNTNLSSKLDLNDFDSYSEKTEPQLPVNCQLEIVPELSSNRVEIVENVLQNCTDQICNESLPNFQQIDENIYLFERKKSKSKKETKKMVCDCILTKEERAKGIMGCGDDCLNRMLMIECSSRCPLGDHCSNKRFTKKRYSSLEPFKTQKKGWGLRACENIPPDSFLMEYVGEVIDPFDFHKRVEKYAKQKLEHHYFMALRADEIIDATCKGNITRFVNHSCEPNSQTQKWTVNGELRIGFFSIKHIGAGEEITFDYQFQRYGKKAQKCYCGSASCRGVIGGESANILTDGSKIPKAVSKKSTKKKKKEVLEQPLEEKFDDYYEDELESESEEEFENIEDIGLEEEIQGLLAQGGLRNRQQIIVVSRLMLRAEECQARLSLISIIMSTIEIAYLRLFIDYHGLQIIWSWMVEVEDIDLKARLLELLEILPIPNKTMLTDSKVYSVVERWAQKDSPESQQFLNFSEQEVQKENEKNETINNVEVGPSTNNIDQELIDKTTPDLEKCVDPSVANGNDVTGMTDLESKSSPEKKIGNKFSNKVVIKTKSKPPSDSETPTPKKSSVSVGFLAQKLLTHWKDLKEVFRIPRLERQKRHKDEEEVDRKAQEDEERRAKGLPSTDKRAYDDRDYTIAGILGNKNRCLKRLTDSNRDYNRPQFLINSNSFNQNNSVNRLTKEEHRKMFEYNLAQTDYAEALKKYQEDLAVYQAAYRNQMAQQQTVIQQLQSLKQTDSNYTPTTTDVLQLSTELSNVFPDLFPLMNQLKAGPAFCDPATNLSSVTTQYGVQNAVGNSVSNAEFGQADLEFEEANLELSLKDIVPNHASPLIALSVNSTESNEGTEDNMDISPYAIDNVDYNQVRYDSDELFESMEKKMFDEMYPPVGVFYITKEGQTYFVSLPSESSPAITVKENVTEPLTLSFTQKPVVNLPYSWVSYELQGHIYYYNQRKNIKQWHPPQDSQIDNFDDTSHIELMNDVDDANYCTSNSNSPQRSKLRSDKERDTDHDILQEESTFEVKRKNTRRIQEHFRNEVSQFVVKCLNPFMRSDCKKGHITNSEDFKYLARKLTHNVVSKEMKACKHIEDLACNKAVKQKMHEYVKKYMFKFGPVYHTNSLD